MSFLTTIVLLHIDFVGVLKEQKSRFHFVSIAT